MFSFFGKSDKRTKPKVRRKCLHCGKQFKALENSTAKFCSKSCREAVIGGTPEQRLERMTDRSSGCWLWLGSVDSHGYGIMSVDGQSRLVHRLSWELSGRSLTDGKMLCHTCHIRRCCNPDHLYEGTHADNMRDMSEANRASAAKTSWQERYAMVDEVLAGVSVLEVARKYNVNPSTVKYWVRLLKSGNRPYEP